MKRISFAPPVMFFAFFAIAAGMAGLTVFTQKGSEDYMGIGINLIFLAVMLVLIEVAVWKMKRMHQACCDFTKADMELQKLSGGSPRAMWRDLRDKGIRFQDNILQERWDSYLGGGISSGAKELEDEEMILFRYHNNFCDMIPGLLTSLGILGTFIGLIIGMTAFSSPEMKTSDMDAISSVVTNMIGGMNVAFYTSIYGVLLSIIYNLVNHMKQQQLADAVTAIRYHLGENFSGVAGDTVMDQLLNMQIQTKDILEQMNYTLSGSIGKEIGAELAPTFKNINQTLEKVIGDYRKALTESMRGVADQFSRDVCNGLDGHINTLGNSVDRLTSSHNTMATRMNDLVDEIGTAVSDTHQINGESQMVIGYFNNYLEETSQMIRNANQTFQNIQTYSGVIYNGAEEQRKVLNELNETFKTLAETEQSFIQIKNPMLEMVSELQDAVDNNNKANQKAIRQIGDVLTEMKSIQLEMMRAQQEERRFMEGMLNAMDIVLARVPEDASAYSARKKKKKGLLARFKLRR